MQERSVNLANFLRQPYPYYFNQKGLGKLAVWIFFLAFLFIYLFEPFNVFPEEHRMSYFWISFWHAAVSSVVFYGSFSIINLRKVEEENWKVWKEIVSLGIVFLIMGVVNFLLRNPLYDNPQNWSFYYLVEEIRNTFLVGILIVLILVPINFVRVHQRNVKKASTLKSSSSENFVKAKNELLITTQLKSDDFILELENFQFAKAEGNYVEFHFSGDRGGHKLLKRITMKDLERQMTAYPEVVKTHRSYLVNLQKVTAVSGNAQGYQLSLQQYEPKIPVSRGMISKVDRALGNAAL